MVQLEIRNLLSKNKHNLTFCNCKECGRVFSKGGSGSAKIVRCSYPYKITCDERAGEKDDFGMYVETFYSKVRKYNQRNYKFTENAIDLTELVEKKLEELSLQKLSSEEIKSQMEEWWKWVKKCCKEDNYEALK